LYENSAKLDSRTKKLRKLNIDLKKPITNAQRLSTFIFTLRRKNSTAIKTARDWPT
jgi:hypothetical protein